MQAKPIDGVVADVRGHYTGRRPDSLFMWNAGEFLGSRRCGR